jgi:RimJ/RimL family protein N-acetyltransferase
MLQPVPVTLVGPCVRMDPLTPHHLSELIAAVRSDPSVSYLASTLAMRDWDSWIAEAMLRVSGGHLVAWVIVRRADEGIIGSTGFGTISTVDSWLGNGWTWLAPAARNGHTNAEVKLLQLRWAFETVGAVRVAFKPDSRDAQSKAARRLVAERGGPDLGDPLPPDVPIRPSPPFFTVAAEWEPLGVALSARLEAMGCHS